MWGAPVERAGSELLGRGADDANLEFTQRPRQETDLGASVQGRQPQ